LRAAHLLYFEKSSKITLSIKSSVLGVVGMLRMQKICLSSFKKRHKKNTKKAKSKSTQNLWKLSLN